MTSLILWCGAGIVVPTLKDLANRVRNAQIRDDYRRRIGDYPTLARRYGLSTIQVRRICNL